MFYLRITHWLYPKVYGSIMLLLFVLLTTLAFGTRDTVLISVLYKSLVVGGRNPIQIDASKNRVFGWYNREV